MQPAAANEVVLVHGLWFRAWAMRLLARRLRGAGFRVRWFSYPSTRVALEASATQLHAQCARSGAAEIHFLGHSLGGLLILLMMQEHAWARPGRIQFLGTPLNGSAVSRRAAQWPGGEHLFGQARRYLAEGAPHWPQECEAGMIAGTRPVGLGRVAGGLEQPNDGTVSVAETMHPGLTDRIELPVTHTGMLYARDVARQAAAFLRNGRYEKHPGTASGGL